MSRRKKSKYDRGVFVEVENSSGKKVMVNRACCHLKPETVTAKDGTLLTRMSDRMYIQNADGSLRSTKTKIPKKERRRLREENAKLRSNQALMAAAQCGQFDNQ